MYENHFKYTGFRSLNGAETADIPGNEYTTIYSVRQNKILPEKHGFLTGVRGAMSDWGSLFVGGLLWMFLAIIIVLFSFHQFVVYISKNFMSNGLGMT